MAERLTVLWVAAPTDRRPQFLQELADSGCAILHASSCDEARRFLSLRRDFSLVVSAAHLTDGNWYSVLASLVHQGGRAGFVVAADAISESFRQRVRDRGGIDAVEVGAAMRAAGRLSTVMAAPRV